MERICKVHGGALSGGCGHCLLDLLCSLSHHLPTDGKRGRSGKVVLKEWTELNKQLSGEFDLRKFYGTWTKRRGGACLYDRAYARWCVYLANQEPAVRIPEDPR